MMYLTILIGLMISSLTGPAARQNVFTTKNAEITLFSEAPMENIEAVSRIGYGVVNIATGEIQFGVSIRSFQFKKSLMQEHFNENYMESDKFPSAKFKGKLNIPLDIKKNGTFNVTAVGDFEVHGVTKRRTFEGTVRVYQGQFELNSVFEVKCKDHQIKIPKLVFRNVAETIRITLKGNFKSTT